MVKADLHNHLRTSKRVLNGDFNRVIDATSAKLGEDAIIGIVNRSDRKYEELVSQRGYDREFIEGNGSVVYVPEKKVYLVKGQQVQSNEGNLLVLGVPKGVNLLEGKSLEDTIKEAQEKWGIIIASNLLHKNGIWNYLIKNLNLVEYFDGIEVYNSKAEFSCPLSPYASDANGTAKDFYRFVRGEYFQLGALSSSDGDSFYEIGSSYTELPNPDKNNFKKWLKDSIHKTNLETKRKNSPSRLGAIDHLLDSFLIENVGSKVGLI